jgi:hypothetical protein
VLAEKLNSGVNNLRLVDLLLKDRENNQVVHGHLGDVVIVGNGPSGTSGHCLVVGMHGTVVLDAVRGATGAAPVLWVRLAIRPLASELSIEG